MRPDLGFLVLCFCLASSVAICQSSNQATPSESSSQAASTQPSSVMMANLVKIYRASDPNGDVATFSDPAFWLRQTVNIAAQTTQQAENANQTVAKNAASAAQGRTDQQTTAPTAAAGSTSALSKGSVPWLLGFAEEYGGLTQSVTGSTTTVNGNVANIIKALSAQTYLESFKKEENNQWISMISKASFSLAFDTGTSSSSTATSTTPSQFSNATAHIDFINHRDPRDKEWRTEWSTFVNNPNNNIASAEQAFDDEIKSQHPAAYKQWNDVVISTLSNLANFLKTAKASQNDQDTRITGDLETIWTSYQKIIKVLGEDQKDATGAVVVEADQQLIKLEKAFNGVYVHYGKDKQTVVNEINSSKVFSFEYTFTDQSSVQLPKSTTQTYSIGTTAPNLSNFNFIFQAPFLKASAAQFIANASTTLFMSPAAQLKVTPVRDYKISAGVDIPVPALASLAKSTISLSGLFQDLLQEPLGQKVTVNGASVTNTGNIILGQAKWSFPVGSSGVTFPVSFTGSNRTDLIKETDLKGTVGISYNLDSLLSKQP